MTTKGFKINNNAYGGRRCRICKSEIPHGGAYHEVKQKRGRVLYYCLDCLKQIPTDKGKLVK